MPHTLVGRAVGVSWSWNYKWWDRRRRPATSGGPASQTDPFAASGDTYGSPRMVQDLWAEGPRVSVNSVAEIMAEKGLVAGASGAPTAVLVRRVSARP